MSTRIDVEHSGQPPSGAPGRMDRLASLLAPRVVELGTRGTLAAPLVIVLVVSLVSSTAAWAWASSAPPGSGAALLHQSGVLVWLLALAAPVAAALRGVFLASMAWGILVLLGGTPAIRALLSAFFYGEAILSAQALWVTGGALLLSLPAADQAGALPIPSGLDAFVTSGSGALLAAAQNVTPFHMAWIVFLTLAFSAHAGVSRGRGAGAALMLWGLSAGMAVLASSVG